MYSTNLNPSKKREELKARMDDFTSFSWRGINGFDQFGAFIVGGKDALKFYNGPGFSNKYIKPQFESANSILTGVEFQTQKISFTVGVYWFTIQEYRQFLHWLHPYEVNELVFHHAPEWRYLVKVSQIGDSTRYVLGRDSDGEYRYYTEIKLSFEVQGPSCLYSTTAYDFKWESKDNMLIGRFSNQDKDYRVSDLNTPIDCSFSVVPTAILQEGEIYPQTQDLYPGDALNLGSILKFGGTNYRIALKAILPYECEKNGAIVSGNEVTLFDTTLQHLTESLIYIEGSNTPIRYLDDMIPLHLRYISESGILLIQFGQSEEKILTLQTSTPSGKRLCQVLQVNKFFLPGQLEYPALNLDQDLFKTIQFKLILSNNLRLVQYPLSEKDGQTEYAYDISVESYARTNIV